MKTFCKKEDCKNKRAKGQVMCRKHCNEYLRIYRKENRKLINEIVKRYRAKKRLNNEDYQ